jgi:hypothetical protein
MKFKPKMKLAFRGSITAAYQAWEARLNEKFVQGAGNPRLAAIRVQPDRLVFSAKGRSI